VHWLQVQHGCAVDRIQTPNSKHLPAVEVLLLLGSVSALESLGGDCSALA
jgi:hypothetical protein